MVDPNKQPEIEYDRLDDQGQLSAAEIREQTGYVTDGENADFSVAAIEARNPDIALAREAGATALTEGGAVRVLPGTSGRDASRIIANQTNPYTLRTPEQRAHTSEHVALVRAQIRQLGDR